jgi:peroxiredoxin
MRVVIPVVFYLMLISACSGDNHNFTLRITVNNSDGGALYLARRTLSGTVLIDSAVPDKSGTYVLEGFASQPDFYIVYRIPRHFINLIIKPGDDFKVLTEASSFEYSYLVEGSKDSRLIQKLVSMQTRTLEKITEISNEYERRKGEPGFEKTRIRIDSTYKQIVEEHRDFSKTLIEENPGSLAGLMALYQQLGRDIPVFDHNTDFRYYEMVDSSLASAYPGSEAVKDLNKKVTELRNLLRLEKGSQAPDIEMPDLQGNNQSLQTLRGKYVLLVFWASWSSQSCTEVKKVVPVYKQYADKDLECFMVSLDRSRDSWLKRMEEIQASGIQVSDLKYWDSPVVESYRINHLPVMYLLDKEGKIIHKDFSTVDLPRFLEGLIGSK